MGTQPPDLQTHLLASLGLSLHICRRGVRGCYTAERIKEEALGLLPPDTWHAVASVNAIFPLASSLGRRGGLPGPQAPFSMVLPSGLRCHSSVPRTLIHGDKKGGFTIFWADDGLDTGDLLLQKECEVLPDDTVSSLYNRFLFPEGVKGMVRAGPHTYPRAPQSQLLP